MHASVLLWQAEDTETAGGRYLPATCAMLDWLRLTAAGPNAGYLALRDDDAQQALWTGVARLLNALPADPQPLSGTERSTALPEDVALRGVAPLEPVLALRVPSPVSAAAAARLRMHRVRAFGVWAAGGGLPSCLFYHPQVSETVSASDFRRFGRARVAGRVG